MDTNHVIERRNIQDIPFPQNHIGVSARIGQGRFQVNGNRIGGNNGLAGGIGLGGIQLGFHHLYHLAGNLKFFRSSNTGEVSTAHEGEFGETAGLPHQIRHTFLPVGKREIPREVYFSFHGEVTLDIIGGTLVHHYFVVRFQYKRALSGIGQAVFQGEGIHLANITGGHHAVGVFLATGHIHAGGGGAIQQTAGHDDEVLDGGILGKGIFAGIGHHTGNGHGSLVLEVEGTGNEKFIVVLQHEVRTQTGQDIRKVQGEYLLGFVRVFTVHHHAVGIGLRHQAAGLGHQFLGSMHGRAQLISAREEHGTMDGKAVLEAGLQFTNFHPVSVAHHEGGKLLILYCAHLKALLVLTVHGNGIGIGTVSKAAGIIQQLGQRFPILQFKVHGTFDAAFHGYQALVRTHQNNVSLVQTDVAGHGTVEQELIHVHPGHHFVAAENLDITQGTGFYHTACLIQGVEGRGKGRKNIGARMRDIPHHRNLDGTDLAQAQAHVGAGTLAQTAVNLGKALLEVFISFLNGHSTQVYGPQNIHVDAAFRRDGAAKGGLVAAEDIDNHFISGAQAVIARRGQIFTGGKVQVLIAENAAAIYVDGIRHHHRVGRHLGHI